MLTMKWFDRILTGLRAAARDLLSEEDTPEESDRLDSLLETAQTRLHVLRSELAQAIAREKRAEIDWRAGWEQANALDAGIDSALRAGQDDIARSQIEQASRAQVKADELSEVAEVWSRMSFFCRSAMVALSSLKNKYPYCGTPELYDMVLDYKLACEKRYRGAMEEVACQKTEFPKGLLPEIR